MYGFLWHLSVSVVYGSETGEINLKNSKRSLHATEVRRLCGVSRLHCVRNVNITREIRMDGRVLDVINTKRLVCFVERMSEERWLTELLNLAAHRGRQRDRHRSSSGKNIYEKIGKIL